MIKALTNAVRKAVIVYLASSPRPINELLNPNPPMKGFAQVFEKEFLGMTDDKPTTSEELIDVGRQLIQLILKDLTQDERKFLISFKTGSPDWSLAPVPGMKEFPAVRWKLENIEKIPDGNRKKLVGKLKTILEI